MESFGGSVLAGATETYSVASSFRSVYIFPIILVTMYYLLRGMYFIILLITVSCSFVPVTGNRLANVGILMFSILTSIPIIPCLATFHSMPIRELGQPIPELSLWKEQYVALMVGYGSLFVLQVGVGVHAFWELLKDVGEARRAEEEYVRAMTR